MQPFLEQCEREVAAGWAAMRRGNFWQHVLEHGFDRELYAGLMTEIYHYTHHNAQNQAVAAARAGSDRLPLLRFCLRHALEEAGHDLMVLHDLESIGVDPEAVRRRRPLAETQAFVAYLYRVAETRDATARLGYSYWAESCYPYVGEILQSMRTSLGLVDRQMTFFVAHAEIDREHFKEVEEIASSYCTTEELRRDFLEVLSATLQLQGAMLEGVYRHCAAARALA